MSIEYSLVQPNCKDQFTRIEAPFGAENSINNQVVQQLRSNPSVCYAGHLVPSAYSVDDLHDSIHALVSAVTQNSRNTKEFEIYIAPQQASYDIGALNEFMQGLIEGIDPSSIVPFTPLKDLFGFGDDTGGIDIGALNFKEPMPFQDDVTLHTRVQVYPHPRLAQAVYGLRRDWQAGTVKNPSEELHRKLSNLQHFVTRHQIRTMQRLDGELPNNMFVKMVDAFREKLDF